MSFKHTYASRVPTILATMEDVLLSNSRASPAEASEPVTADVVEALPEGVEATAGVAASEDSAGTSTTTAGAQPDRTAASPLPACSPSTCTKAATAHGTTAIATKMAGSDPQRTRCCQPAEAVPTADEDRIPADRRSGRFPPTPPPRTVLKKTAEHRRDGAENVAVSGNRGNLDGGNATGGFWDTPHQPPPELAPGFSTGARRPNAPMVLVVYRSEFPPPEDWRKSVQVAAITVAGGGRVTFMEIGETIPEVSTAEYVEGQELKEEERKRRKVLEARLSRLVAQERTGEDERHGT